MSNKIKVLPKDFKKKREELAMKRLDMTKKRIADIQFQRELAKIDSEFGD